MQVPEEALTRCESFLRGDRVHDAGRVAVERALLRRKLAMRVLELVEEVYEKPTFSVRSHPTGATRAHFVTSSAAFGRSP